MSQDIYQWIRENRLYHMCIEDTLKFKVGDVLDVAIFDRNMEEYGMWDKIPPNTSMPATEMFRFNRHQIKWLGDNRWMIIFPWGEFEHNLHYNVESLSTNWTWLAAADFGQFADEIIASDQKIPGERKAWTLDVRHLHPRTRVGWRGPIMLWKHVEANTIPVYWRSRK